MILQIRVGPVTYAALRGYHIAFLLRNGRSSCLCPGAACFDNFSGSCRVRSTGHQRFTDYGRVKPALELHLGQGHLAAVQTDLEGVRDCVHGGGVDQLPHPRVPDATNHIEQICWNMYIIIICKTMRMRKIVRVQESF